MQIEWPPFTFNPEDFNPQNILDSYFDVGIVISVGCDPAGGAGDHLAGASRGVLRQRARPHPRAVEDHRLLALRRRST